VERTHAKERGEAKVGDLEEALVREQKVFGFEVAMADAHGVAVLHSRDQLLEVSPRGVLVESTLVCCARSVSTRQASQRAHDRESKQRQELGCAPSLK
jgi:hypothetical protein